MIEPQNAAFGKTESFGRILVSNRLILAQNGSKGQLKPNNEEKSPNLPILGSIHKA